MSGDSDTKEGLIDLGRATGRVSDLTSDQKVAGSSPAGCIPAYFNNPYNLQRRANGRKHDEPGGAV
jgi:hypothetical protein